MFISAVSCQANRPCLITLGTFVVALPILLLVQVSVNTVSALLVSGEVRACVICQQINTELKGTLGM